MYFTRRKVPSPDDVATLAARLDAVSAWSAHLARWSEEAARRRFDTLIQRARDRLETIAG
jgi:hypothetical protein